MKKLFLTLIILISAVNITFAAEISNEAKLQYNQGVDYYRLGQYDKAMAAFRQAIAIEPNYIDAYYNLGTILEFIKQDEAALVVFKQIIVRNPNDYDAVYKAAVLSQKLGQTDKAKEYLSLIPPTAVVADKAQSLANSMKTDLQTIKKEQQDKINKSKTITQTNGVYQNLASPTGMTTDSNGNLYIAGFSDNSILKISPDGTKKLFAKDARINGPIGLECDSAGNLYVANYNGDNVLKISNKGAISVLIGNVKKPYCLHIAGNLLFISSQGTNSVIRYKL